MRLGRALLALYATRRRLQFLWSQRVSGFEVPDRPHFDFYAQAPFAELLKRAEFFLEFGAGGSTILAAKLGIPTLSVESDIFFAASVRGRIGQTSIINIITPNIGVTSEWGTPMFKRRTPARLTRWRRYVEAPFAYIDISGSAFPNLVLIDGRFRRACALKTAEEAWKRNQAVTVCIDDYAERLSYHSLEAILGAPRMTGRMAVFDIGKTHLPPIRSHLEEALTDWR